MKKKQNRVEKAPLKEMWGEFMTPDWILKNQNLSRFDSKGLPYAYSYDFETLKNSIKEHGLLNPIEVSLLYQEGSPILSKKLGKKYKYKIINGNHRVYCLLEMYGEDYEVEIKFYNNNDELVPDDHLNYHNFHMNKNKNQN